MKNQIRTVKNKIASIDPEIAVVGLGAIAIAAVTMIAMKEERRRQDEVNKAVENGATVLDLPGYGTFIINHPSPVIGD